MDTMVMPRLQFQLVRSILKYKILDVTEESLYKGIEQAIIGNRLSDISHAVQSHVEQYGFGVVRDYVGHGIGRSMHEDPQIPNYGVLDAAHD